MRSLTQEPKVYKELWRWRAPDGSVAIWRDNLDLVLRIGIENRPWEKLGRANTREEAEAMLLPEMGPWRRFSHSYQGSHSKALKTGSRALEDAPSFHTEGCVLCNGVWILATPALSKSELENELAEKELRLQRYERLAQEKRNFFDDPGSMI